VPKFVTGQRPIWIIEESRDGGKTWAITQPYHVYKKEETADRAVERFKGWRSTYRKMEYRPVEGK
jgi:hypothetical protein